MVFIGQETVRKQQRHNFLWRMFTLIAVVVHFNRFIDLKINFHTNPYNFDFQYAVVILGSLCLNAEFRLMTEEKRNHAHLKSFNVCSN